MPEFLPSVPVTSLLVAPNRYRGVGAGTIYLAHEAGGREFTREYKKTLMLFAVQATMLTNPPTSSPSPASTS